MACSVFQRRAPGEAAAVVGCADQCPITAGQQRSAAATVSTSACAAHVSMLWRAAAGGGGPQAAAEQCGVADADLSGAGPTVGPPSAGTCLEEQQRQQQQQEQQAEGDDAPTERACWPDSLVGWIHTRSVVLPRDRARTFWAPEFLQLAPAGDVRPSVTVTLHVDFGAAGTRNGSGPGADGGAQGSLCSGHTAAEARVLAPTGRTSSWHLFGVVPLLRARGAKHGEQVELRRLCDGRLILRVGGGTQAAVLESQRRVNRGDASSAGPERKRQAEVQQQAAPPPRKPWRRPREGCPAPGHVLGCAAGPSGHVEASASGALGAPGLAQQPLPLREHGRSRQVWPCPPDSLLVGCVWRTQVDVRAAAVTALWPTAGGLLHGQSVDVEVYAGATTVPALRGLPAGQQQQQHLGPYSVTLRVYKAKHGRTWRLTGCGALFWHLGARNGDAILMWRSPDGNGRVVAGVGPRDGARSWGKELRLVTAKRGVHEAADEGVVNTAVGGEGDSGESMEQDEGRCELSEEEEAEEEEQEDE